MRRFCIATMMVLLAPTASLGQGPPLSGLPTQSRNQIILPPPADQNGGAERF